MSSKRSLERNQRSVSPPCIHRKPTKVPPHDREMSDANPVLVYSWNVNGIDHLLQKQFSFVSGHSSLFPLRKFLKRHKWPHFLCLQEVKINAQDLPTQRNLERAANVGHEPGEPTYTTHFSLPRDKYNAIGFGGKVHGVATLIRDDFAINVKTIRRPDWDLEGRVLLMELEHNVVIINGYWPNGTDRPYKDPETGDVTGTRHDHKLRFHQHMLEESMRLQWEGRHVILIGDMNIAPARIDGHPNLRTFPEQHVKNRHDFNQKFFDSEDGFRGVDVFRNVFGTYQKYTYHPRGHAWGTSCDRVDLIIATRSLADKAGAIVSTDICANPEDRGYSDHVPLWVSIDWEALSVKAEGSPVELDSSGL